MILNVFRRLRATAVRLISSAFILAAVIGCADSPGIVTPLPSGSAISAKLEYASGDYCWYEYEYTGAQGAGVRHLVCRYGGSGLGMGWSSLLYGFWGNSPTNLGFGNGLGATFDGTVPTIALIPNNPYGTDGVTAGCAQYDDCWQKFAGWLEGHLNGALTAVEKAAIVASVRAQLALAPADVQKQWMDRLISSDVAQTMLAGIKPGDIVNLVRNFNPLLFSRLSDKTLRSETEEPKFHGFPKLVDFILPVSGYKEFVIYGGDGKPATVIVVPIYSYTYQSGGQTYTTAAAAEYIVVYPPYIFGVTLPYRDGVIMHRCLRVPPGFPGDNACGIAKPGVVYPWDP